MSSNKVVASVACLICREKHVRCDAARPSCRRCRLQGIECVYTMSRRGQRPGRQKPAFWTLESFDRSSVRSESRESGSVAQLRKETITPSVASPLDQLIALEPYANTTHNGLSFPSAPDEELLRIYYRSFHPAHPFLPPWSYVNGPLTQLPDALTTSMRFVACHYDGLGKLDTSLEEHTLQLLDTTWIDSPFFVQAALLLAIGLHSRNRQVIALTMLAKARDAALRMSLNHETQIVTLAGNDLVLRESFRRTWWELFTVDAILSTLHKRQSVPTANVPMTLNLPCEDALFDSGRPPSASYLTRHDLDDRFFQASPQPLSSGALRIDAVTILCQALTIDQEDGTGSRFEDVNAMLSSWTHHLPESKREILAGCQGQVDEALFQAHMIINTATILIHVPRSDLQGAHDSQPHIECALKSSVRATISSAHVHSVSAMRAAERLGQMASLPVVSVTSHTPFWICSLVVSSTVHLSACSVSSCTCIKPRRHSVIQALGMLTTLGALWPIAWHALGQLRGAARQANSAGWKPAVGYEYDDGELAGDARLLQDDMWTSDLAGFFDNSNIDQMTEAMAGVE